MCLFDNILIYSWSARYTDGGKKGENRYVENNSRIQYTKRKRIYK